METYYIHDNTEDLFNASIAGTESYNAADHAGLDFILCRFFQVNHKPNPQTLQNIIEDVESKGICTIYAFRDYDIMLVFHNVRIQEQQAVVSDLGDAFGKYIIPHMPPNDFFIRYDLQNDYTRLKTFAMHKVGQRTKAGRKLSYYIMNEGLRQTLSATLRIVGMQRTMRTKPVILAVEDQRFSQKLLMSILKDYTVYIAASSAEALLLYMEKCPGILLLDIDLPDLSGHEFAQLINKIDPEHHIIMVSA
ncbi:MAG: response regulator, partial [Pseudobdellovibrionaceae bacterium]